MTTRKRTTLSKKELKTIAAHIKDADPEESVIRDVQKEQHLFYFEERKSLWCFLIGSSQQHFRFLLQDGLNTFCYLYGEECVKGKDRHLRLMLAWNAFSSTFATESQATSSSRKRWAGLIEGYPNSVRDECRSAVVSAIFSALYSFLVKQIQLILERLQSRCETLLSGNSTPLPDDDVALYRYFGFSLHASIIARRPRSWSHHLKKKRHRICPERRRKMNAQLLVLEHLLETDKTAIPAILKSLDREVST